MKNILPFKAYKLNESVNDLSFATTISNSMDEYFLENSEFASRHELPIDSNTNYDIIDSEFTINWILDIDARSWGIKDIGIIIKNIHGRFTVNIWGDEDDVPYYIDFNSDDYDFKIINSIEIKDSIIPSNIEFDFKNKTITIN